jgi:hypothetical protein
LSTTQGPPPPNLLSAKALDPAMTMAMVAQIGRRSGKSDIEEPFSFHEANSGDYVNSTQSGARLGRNP